MGKEDVTRLLDDFREFLDEEKRRPFYCLQPLVVKKMVGSAQTPAAWEVVDGQQRLTTLLLINKFLNVPAVYELSYQSRERSKEFLDSLSVKTEHHITNIDFHHIYHAHRAIQKWFKDDEKEKARFKTLLEDSDPKGRNVRIIWYELAETDDAVAAFTRLNVGKIALTDEELIRALFLRSAEGGQLADSAFKHRLALEWDRIETALQAADFWGFLSKEPSTKGGRIRLLFELCAPAGIRVQQYALFLYYETTIKDTDAERLRVEWQKVVSCFEQLEEWHSDPVLFHLIGFLTTILENDSISILRGLLESAKAKTKPEFAAELRESIRKNLIGRDTEIPTFVSGLNYKPNGVRKKTLQTLALFNITTLLRIKSVPLRFPFHLYHANDCWDIEHVHSQAGDDLGSRERQLAWLALCENELNEESKRAIIEPTNQSEAQNHQQVPEQYRKILEQIQQFRDKKTEGTFEDLAKTIREHFGEDDSDTEKHGIGNLTLLDAGTNRAYGNAPFAVKRSKILAAEVSGTFILPCTRDLFLKVFSRNPGNLRRWDIDKDGDDHETRICQILEQFFGKYNGGVGS